jgi:hypothetical protein
MKTQPIFNKPQSGGYAILLTLFMAAVSITLLVATMSRLSGDADLNARSGQYNTSLFAAEAAVERVVARMEYDYYNGGEAWISNNLSIYRAYYPGVDSGEAAVTSNYWSNFQFSDAQGNVNATYVNIQGPSRVWQPIQSQWAGLNGWATTYRVLSNAKQTNGRFSLTNAVQEDIELDSIPVFQFAVFYNGLMEYTWCATFAVNGRTHANGNIFISASSGATLTFNSLVTSTGGIYQTNWDGHLASAMGPTIFATNNAAGTPGYSTNVAVLQLPIGTANTPSAVQQIVQLPPAGGDTNTALAQSRFYNKAGVVVLVSNASITVSVKTSMTDTPTNIVEVFAPTNKYVSTNFPWLTVSSNAFVDFREASKKVKATEIDVGVLKNWLPTNAVVLSKFTGGSGQYPNIFYIADLRDQASTELAAVRLKNGSIIPTNGAASPTGWTIATLNPLYVQGNYNLGPGGAAGTNNTSATYPASLVSDALTILSTNWNDSLTLTNNTLSSRSATSTTINAAVLTGTVYSNPTDWTDTNHFSGGVMNLPRLLESWTGQTLTMNTSIVNLFNSMRATNFFVNPGLYYFAPTRAFTFDNNFTNYAKLPPGTPTVSVLNRANWRVPPPNNVNYAGR